MAIPERVGNNCFRNSKCYITLGALTVESESKKVECLLYIMIVNICL